MSRTIPNAEPTELTAGDSWQWNRSVSDFPPSDGWSLSYSMTGAGSAVVTISATTASDGDYFEVRVAAATTADYEPGRYDLFGHATKGADRFLVYQGPLVVDPDPATATPELSFNERMLAKLETKISDRLTADISAYTLAQQEVHREELATLQRQRNGYAEAVRRERSGRRQFFQNVAVSFGAPS